jgi:hypothetical protein
MPKRLAPLNAMQVERIKPGEELIDGAVPGLRVSRTAAGLSWGLSVRVKGARRWIKVGVGIGLAEARRRAERLRQDIADGKDPAEERAAAKQRDRDAVKGVGTLRGVMNSYFEHRSELRSGATQRKALLPVFKDWLDKPALDLTQPLAQLAIDKWARTRSATLASRAVTYFKPLAKWAGRRGLMSGRFGELERPTQAVKKTVGFVPSRRRRNSAVARRILPRHRHPCDAPDRRALQRGVQGGLGRVRFRPGSVDAAGMAAQKS